MTIQPLFCDIFHGDLNGTPNIPALIAAGPPWHGLIMKASEGLWDEGSWLMKCWKAASQTDRLGADWFMGGYHYVQFNKDPLAQVDTYMRAIDKAGGWNKGCLWATLDVESADNDPNVSKQAIIDCTSTMAMHLKARTGKPVTLYGGSLMRDKGITDHMGCERLWVARYSATLPAETYTDIGWQLADLFMWQAVGDGEGYWSGYPTVSPIGKVDISALVIDGGLDYLKDEPAG